MELWSPCSLHAENWPVFKGAFYLTLYHYNFLHTSFSTSQDQTPMKRQLRISSVSLKTSINGRTQRKSTPTSPVPRILRTCSLCLTLSPMSS